MLRQCPLEWSNFLKRVCLQLFFIWFKCPISGYSSYTQLWLVAVLLDLLLNLLNGSYTFYTMIWGGTATSSCLWVQFSNFENRNFFKFKLSMSFSFRWPIIFPNSFEKFTRPCEGVNLKGAGSRVRPRDNVVVWKLVDGVNPPQQLNWYLVGECIAAHR